MRLAQNVALELALVKSDGVAVEEWKTANVELRTLQGRFCHYVLDDYVEASTRQGTRPSKSAMVTAESTRRLPSLSIPSDTLFGHLPANGTTDEVSPNCETEKAFHLAVSRPTRRCARQCITDNPRVRTSGPELLAIAIASAIPREFC